MSSPLYPSLYQINTRVWLTELGRGLGRRATLDDVPDAVLDEWAATGFGWIWLLSVWQTGLAAQAISRTNAGWRHEFELTLPDLTEEDIAGSGFAITGYTVHRALGGEAALARLRERLRARGLKLMLDFVPNHMAPDHPWAGEHPDYFVEGTEADLARAPENFFRVSTPGGARIFAYGRDPYFAGWPDTIQINYANPALQESMGGELLRIATQCDGVRCDMAMLILPEVLQKTWNVSAASFWPMAIPRVRAQTPGFVFMAEVYWEMEWALQQLGFDFCYDKRLYDRLREGAARPVREHFLAGLDYQRGLARFLENHDELRAAVTFDITRHRAAAVLTYLSPGLRFFHQGQLEGRMKHISPHLVRGPQEATDPAIAEFYTRLLAVLRQPVVRDGRWQLLEGHAAWEGNWTHECCVAFGWEKSATERMVVVVNFSDHQSQGKLTLPFALADAPMYRFADLLGGGSYDWASTELVGNGLYVDLPAWGTQVFSVSAVE